MSPTLTRFREQCTQALASSIQELYHLDLPDAMLEEPPSVEFGQLASSVPFELGKKFETRPMEIAKKIADRIDVSTFDLIDRVEPAGSGYVNFHLDFTTGWPGDSYGFDIRRRTLWSDYYSRNPRG